MAEDEIGEALASEAQPNGDNVADSIDDAVKDSGELGASIEEGVNLGGDGDVVDDEAAAEEVAEDDDSRENEVENEASQERRMWTPIQHRHLPMAQEEDQQEKVTAAMTRTESRRRGLRTVRERRCRMCQAF
jgi:hypothetical protein